MTRRLLLGCGPVGRAVFGSLAALSGDLVAVFEAEGRRESDGDGIEVRVGDPTDPGTYPDAVDAVVVACSDREIGREAVRAARDRYPETLLVASLTEPGADVVAAADRVVDPTVVTADAVLDVAVGPVSARLYELLTTLRGLDGPLAVITHDNPDPDAIASALALVRIAESVGVEADACFFGDISHQENRALVNLLDIDLLELETPEDVADYAGIALVDHSRPGVNDGLALDTPVDVVIDHHPPRGPVEATSQDLRSDAGATSTLLTEYFETLGLEPDRTIATALLYGIRVDTRDFTREVSTADFEAVAFLLPYADHAVLERVETPSMSAEVLETYASAIRNRTVRGEALSTCVGYIRDRDALAQAADALLNMEGVSVALVFGILDDTIYVSGRTRGTSVDLGETLRTAFDQIGSAGGHENMAGAQLPLGPFSDVGEDSAESLLALVDQFLSERFFESLESAPRPLSPRDELQFESEYDPDLHVVSGRRGREHGGDRLAGGGDPGVTDGASDETDGASDETDGASDETVGGEDDADSESATE